MSTQHPDNVTSPFFAENSEIGGEDEIQEAYYVFSHLGCDEQMWDCEGKEVDNYVIKKLLTKYESFFSTQKLGENLFITLRVPNPTVERAEAKILLETLESIPRSYDAAQMFNDEGVAPIFEVILPMTTSPRCIDRIYRYYSDFVVGKQYQAFKPGDITIANWIGKFKPEKINVIPLFEDMEHMLDAHNITKQYIENKDVHYQRVFLARSDPAMNYGLISAVLLNKIALQRLHYLSEDTGVDIYPIVGVGSAPFRGNLKPSTAERVAEEYASAHTLTIQSAFKYDNDAHEVKNAVDRLRKRKRTPPRQVDEEKCLKIIKKYAKEYQKQITVLAPVINKVAKCIPRRRKRKLHVGLFGYSRRLKGMTLPRAITFTASLYSIGLPPEILGLNALNEKEIDFVQENYVHFEDDLIDSLKYLNHNSKYLPKSLRTKIKDLSIPLEIDETHKELTTHIGDSLSKNNNGHIADYVLRAANLRKFLG